MRILITGILFFLLACVQTVSAQKYGFERKDLPKDLSQLSDPNHIIFCEDDKHIVSAVFNFNNDIKHYYWKVFSRTDLSLVKENKVVLPNDFESFLVIKPIVINSKSYIIGVKKTKTSLTIQNLQVDYMTGAIQREIELLQLDMKDAKGFFKEKNLLHVSLSPEQKILGIGIAYPSQNSAKKILHRIVTFDQNFKMINNKELEVEVPKGHTMSVNDFKTDDLGNSTLLLFSKSAESRSVIGYTEKYFTLSLFSQTQKIENHPIEIKDKYIQALAFEYASDGALFVAGYYSKSSDTNCEGEFFMKYDANGVKQDKVEQYPFQKIEIEENRKVKGGQKGSNDEEISDFNFSCVGLFLRPDGTFQFVSTRNIHTSIRGTGICIILSNYSSDGKRDNRIYFYNIGQKMFNKSTIIDGYHNGNCYAIFCGVSEKTVNGSNTNIKAIKFDKNSIGKAKVDVLSEPNTSFKAVGGSYDDQDIRKVNSFFSEKDGIIYVIAANQKRIFKIKLPE